GRDLRPLSRAHTSSRVRAPNTSASAASAASPALAAGTTSLRPSAAAATAAGRAASIRRSSPVRPSSPMNAVSRRESGGIWPLAARMPSAIGRSKRPPCLGRSAGARLTVMRRCGNSNWAQWIAARTRSLASRTAASGRPTMDMPGSPPARWTSTATAGAETPARARPCTSASAMGNASVGGRRRGLRALAVQFGLHPLHGLLQRFQLLAGAQQHRALDFELLAGDQVELGQPALQHRLEVLLDFLAAFAHRGRYQAAEAARQFVDMAQFDHGFSMPPWGGEQHGARGGGMLSARA